MLYLALEKRYNFSLNDLDVVANGYSHFCSYLKDGKGKNIAVKDVFFTRLSLCTTLIRIIFWFHDGDAEYGDVESGSVPCFVGKRIDITRVPQYVRKYDRGNDVEIWQIKYKKGISHSKCSGDNEFEIM